MNIRRPQILLRNKSNKESVNTNLYGQNEVKRKDKMLLDSIFYISFENFSNNLVTY